MAEPMQSYRAVSCSRCRDPIPVCERVIRSQENQRGQANVLQTFVARCKLCECESVYAVSDIQLIAGAPRQRRPRARAVGA